MLPFGVTIPATVPQRSEIPEGLMNYPVFFQVSDICRSVQPTLSFTAILKWFATKQGRPIAQDWKEFLY
jgi:hypothetical protein